jgi:hypothetical protein
MPSKQKAAAPIIRGCVVKPDRVEYGKAPSEIDKMYSDLMVLNARAACDQQYDPKMPAAARPANEGFDDAAADLTGLILKAVVAMSAVFAWHFIR